MGASGFESLRSTTPRIVINFTLGVMLFLENSMRGVLLLTQRNCQLLKELYQQITADAQAAVAPKLIELPGGKVLLVQGGISNRGAGFSPRKS